VVLVFCGAEGEGMEGDDEKEELRGGRRGDGAADGVLVCKICPVV